MTVKQFFQGKVFKCILVLLCIALVSGGLLAILNDLWAVSDEEIIGRAVTELTGGTTELDKTISTEKVSYDLGTVDEVHLLKNGDYLIKATGNNGFHSGTVSVYVLADFEGTTFKSVSKVSIAEYASSQTLMSKFSDAVLAKFAGLNSAYTGEPKTIASGATYSSTAVKNAVNTTVEYINSELTKEVA